MAKLPQPDPFADALERLRLRHLTFRRIEPEDVRELEAMRLQLLTLRAEVSSPDSQQLDAIADIQLRLLERAFYVLRLDHFANAPENQGWMNLFRQWGRSDSFTAHYRRYQQTVSKACRTFFETYLQNWPESIEDRPIHHPWRGTAADRGPGLFMDTGRVEPMITTMRSRAGAGDQEDIKGRSDRDQTHEQPSGAAGEKKAPNE